MLLFNLNLSSDSSHMVLPQALLVLSRHLENQVLCVGLGEKVPLFPLGEYIRGHYSLGNEMKLLKMFS